MLSAMERSPKSTDPVVRALWAVGTRAGQYVLGAGRYHPHAVEVQAAAATRPTVVEVDEPWSERDGLVGCDCRGFTPIWTHRLHSAYAGLAKGGPVEDDINTDSIVYDARHAAQLFTIVNGWGPGGLVRQQPRSGDLLVYASIRDKADRIVWPHLGHISMVMIVQPTFDSFAPRYSELRVAHCHGPQKHRPGIEITDGSIWDHHNHLWLTNEHPERGALIVRLRDSVSRA